MSEINYAAEIARNQGIINASRARVEARIDAVAENESVHELLRLQAWGRERRLSGTPEAIVAPPGWPTGYSLEGSLRALLAPYRAALASGTGGIGEAAENPYLQRFRDELEK